MKKGKIEGNVRNAWWAKFTGLLSLLSAIFFIIVGVPHADAEKFTSGTEQAPSYPGSEDRRLRLEAGCFA